MTKSKIWARLGLLFVLGLTPMAPATATLIDGAYVIEPTGIVTGGGVVEGRGTFDVVLGVIQDLEFTFDLTGLIGLPPGVIGETYRLGTASNEPDGTMFSASLVSATFASTVDFNTDGTYSCGGPIFGPNSNSCVIGTSDTGFSHFPGNLSTGTYEIVSAIPLPAAAWMFLTALGGLGLFGWRKNQATAG